MALHPCKIFRSERTSVLCRYVGHLVYLVFFLSLRLNAVTSVTFLFFTDVSCISLWASAMYVTQQSSNLYPVQEYTITKYTSLSVGHIPTRRQQVVKVFQTSISWCTLYPNGRCPTHRLRSRDHLLHVHYAIRRSKHAYNAPYIASKSYTLYNVMSIKPY